MIDSSTPRILVVDDQEKMQHLLSMMLEREGYRVSRAGSGEEALALLMDAPFDMVISDIKMDGMDGLALLEEIKAKQILAPVVFITAFATVESAVEAMQLGAADYITKPFEASRILLTVERTLKLSRVLYENRELKHRLQRAEGQYEIIYASKAMALLMGMADRVARSDSAVLISGESGTGKELIARHIHRMSHRCDRRFVPVNCAAISAGLVESELFGHEKGAFTGADRKAEGKFEYASGGTLFLDEIGDLPLEAQAKLLRALQEKRIQRVGGNEEIAVDVRVICATNQEIPKRLDAGEFRQDLYFRINVFPIEPPPLRKRMEDIPPLARFFLSRLGAAAVSLEPSAVRALTGYPWPGNVRELANAIERAVILAGESGRITEETLSFLSPPSACASMAGSWAFAMPPGGIDLEALENDLVGQALDMAGGNQTAAAKLLGLSRAKFRVLMKQADR
ncbi:sigma-54-dependent transcriptional regulator [Desulfococcus sp.]|uniref:sigma-54-dependent transcriptional regulator n=1 Tax=Desulfococcus sp. TaxID=2025834 RepID=UPI0035930996